MLKYVYGFLAILTITIALILAILSAPAQSDEGECVVYCEDKEQLIIYKNGCPPEKEIKGCEIIRGAHE